MIKLIIGRKGTGKTKQLVDMINAASENSKGSVVCVEKGPTLTYDLKHTVRLIDTDSFEIAGFDAFYGFIAGILAGNYDITEVFIDSILKIGGRDLEGLGNLFDKLNKIANDVSLVFTVSADESELPASVKAYL